MLFDDVIFTNTVSGLRMSLGYLETALGAITTLNQQYTFPPKWVNAAVESPLVTPDSTVLLTCPNLLLRPCKPWLRHRGQSAPGGYMSGTTKSSAFAGCCSVMEAVLIAIRGALWRPESSEVAYVAERYKICHAKIGQPAVKGNEH